MHMPLKPDWQKELNITPTRLKALQYLATKPDGVYVRALANQLLVSEYRRNIKSGFSAQQATRSGAGCAVPLIRAGLLVKRDTEYGWGIVSITDAGLKIVAEHEAASEPAEQTLEAVLERCIES